MTDRFNQLEYFVTSTKLKEAIASRSNEKPSSGPVPKLDSSRCYRNEAVHEQLDRTSRSFQPIRCEHLSSQGAAAKSKCSCCSDLDLGAKNPMFCGDSMKEKPTNSNFSNSSSEIRKRIRGTAQELGIPSLNLDGLYHGSNQFMDDLYPGSNQSLDDHGSDRSLDGANHGSNRSLGGANQDSNRSSNRSGHKETGNDNLILC